jgi:hypothetical protein
MVINTLTGRQHGIISIYIDLIWDGYNTLNR